MTTENKDQKFIDTIKSELDESVDNINVRDLSAITQARHRSLDRDTGRKSRWLLVPAGAVVTACLVVVVYSLMQVTPVPTDGVNLVQENQAQEDQELVSTSENFDFYEDPEISEELDFYEWLDAYESSS